MVVVHDGWRSRVRLIADLCEFFFANGSNVIGSLSQQKDTVDPFDPTPNDIGGLSFSINDFVFIRDKARKAWNWILLHTKYRE